MNNTTVSESLNDSPGVLIAPPVIFYLCLGLGGVLELIHPSPVGFEGPLLRVFAGLIVSGAGFAFMMWAHEQFRKSGANVRTNLPAPVFVTKGAYGVSRNPMYVGGAFFFAGLGLALGSFWMLASFLPLALYVRLYVIPKEEAYMERTYPDEYRSYRRKVRRWL